MTRIEKIFVSVILTLFVFLALIFAATSDASCQTHKCWHRVHIVRAEKSVEKKIVRITPYKCWTMVGVIRSARSCWIITQESAMVRIGPWRALNFGSNGVPCWARACGPYQFLGHDVPWPVLVRSKYETLKRKLAHHRMALRLPVSAWGG